MAASKKKHVKVVGLRDSLVVGDLEIDRTGTEVTQKQLDEVLAAAKHTGMQVEVAEADDSGDDSPPNTNTASSATSSQTGGS